METSTRSAADNISPTNFKSQIDSTGQPRSTLVENAFGIWLGGAPGRPGESGQSEQAAGESTRPLIFKQPMDSKLVRVTVTLWWTRSSNVAGCCSHAIELKDATNIHLQPAKDLFR